MKATPIDLSKAFSELTSLSEIKATDPAELPASSSKLSDIGDAGLFVTSFAGKTPWERHPGDELVLVREGHADLILLIDDEEVRLTLSTGQLIVVPINTWHRFETDGVSVVGVTPQPTEVSWDEKPQ